MPRPKPDCGTRAGYEQHMRDKTHPCDECREAKRLHMQAYRDNKAQPSASVLEKRQREAERALAEAKYKAWWKACSRLAERYPAEFREILLEEMSGVDLGLPPEGDNDDQG